MKQRTEVGSERAGAVKEWTASAKVECRLFGSPFLPVSPLKTTEEDGGTRIGPWRESGLVNCQPNEKKNQFDGMNQIYALIISD